MQIIVRLKIHDANGALFSLPSIIT